MHSRFSKHIALLLVAVFSLLIVPKELLHELNTTHHTDTIDVSCNCDMQHLDVQHTHCAILQLAAPVFFHFAKKDTPPRRILVSYVYNFIKADHIPGFACFCYLRGPPVV